MGFPLQVAKKIKEKFLKEVSRVVVKVLDPFRRPDVKRGHIRTTEDFKHLAKKVTSGGGNIDVVLSEGRPKTPFF